MNGFFGSASVRSLNPFNIEQVVERCVIVTLGRYRLAPALVPNAKMIHVCIVYARRPRQHPHDRQIETQSGSYVLPHFHVTWSGTCMCQANTIWAIQCKIDNCCGPPRSSMAKCTWMWIICSRWYFFFVYSPSLWKSPIGQIAARCWWFGARVRWAHIVSAAIHRPMLAILMHNRSLFAVRVNTDFITASSIHSAGILAGIHINRSTVFR